MAGWDAARVADVFHVSRESLAGLQRYHDLLVQWQARINLIAPSTLPDIWGRHLADSLQLLPHLPRQTNVIADLGSGAGFPGLALAIAGGQHVHLHESAGKKAAFLREAARVSGALATIHCGRIESAKPAMTVDAVTARALAPLDQLLSLSEPWLSRGATGLFLKGQDVDAEIIQATKSWNIAYKAHPSLTDSAGVILVITSATRRA